MPQSLSHHCIWCVRSIRRYMWLRPFCVSVVRNERPGGYTPPHERTPCTKSICFGKIDGIECSDMAVTIADGKPTSREMMKSLTFRIVLHPCRRNGKYSNRPAVTAAVGMTRLIFDFRLMIISDELSTLSSNVVVEVVHSPLLKSSMKTAMKRIIMKISTTGTLSKILSRNWKRRQS